MHESSVLFRNTLFEMYFSLTDEVLFEIISCLDEINIIIQFDWIDVFCVYFYPLLIMIHARFITIEPKIIILIVLINLLQIAARISCLWPEHFCLKRDLSWYSPKYFLHLAGFPTRDLRFLCFNCLKSWIVDCLALD